MFLLKFYEKSKGHVTIDRKQCLTWKAEYKPGTTDTILLTTNQVQLKDGQKQAKTRKAYFDCSGDIRHDLDFTQTDGIIGFILRPGTEYQYIGVDVAHPSYMLLYSHAFGGTLS